MRVEGPCPAGQEPIELARAVLDDPERRKWPRCGAHLELGDPESSAHGSSQQEDEGGGVNE